MTFSIWARISLGRNWSGRVVVKEGHRLVSTGPYAFVRHPIYTGLLVALAGSALYDGSWRALLGLTCFAIGFWLKARSEEELLERELGDDYRAYQARTPMLVPSLRPPDSAASGAQSSR
jgi:protein-S-isoprenylcysteine O-methyltransferase Ste14